MKKKKKLHISILLAIFITMLSVSLFHCTSSGKKLLPLGTRAPEWELPDSSGNMVSSQNYKGDILLIDFWATWCIPCIQSMPKLDSLWRKYADKGLRVVGVSAQEQQGADPVSFARKMGAGYDILLQGDSLVKAFNITGFPALFLINREGEVVFAKQGLNKEMYRTLEGLIQGLTDSH